MHSGSSVEGVAPTQTFDETTIKNLKTLGKGGALYNLSANDSEDQKYCELGAKNGCRRILE